MRYDPSRRALYHPEDQGPVFGAPGSWTRDALCAELSRLAYIRFEDDPETLRQALGQGGFAAPALFVDAAEDAQGYGTVGPDGTVYVIFRGTQADSTKDVVADADVVPVSWPGGGRVHRGFRDAENALSEPVEAWLARLGGAAPVVTGHSLGAAMATLLAARVRGADLVTFGSPRVGSTEFAASFAGRNVRRYVDCCDMVTTLPPNVGYKHLEGERYIDRSGRVQSQPPGGLERIRDRSLAALTYLRRCSGRPGNVAVRDLADHAPINYVSALLGVRQGP
jgi:pimeloyl-ACP methyl ester carboxylesterase